MFEKICLTDVVQVWMITAIPEVSTRLVVVLPFDLTTSEALAAMKEKFGNLQEFTMTRFLSGSFIASGLEGAFGETLDHNGKVVANEEILAMVTNEENRDS